MIERYDNAEDAIPHEANVLALSELDELFGEPSKDVFEKVRREVNCDKLVIEEHYRSLDNLPEFEKLIQYSVWVVHHSSLLVEQDSPLPSFLEAGSVPDETQVVVVVDAADDQLVDYLTEEIEQTYNEDITVLSDRSSLVYYLVGHFKTASPCSPAGLDYITSWNNSISDRIGRHQEFE